MATNKISLTESGTGDEFAQTAKPSCNSQECVSARLALQNTRQASISACINAMIQQQQRNWLFDTFLTLWIMAAVLTAAAYILVATIIGIPAAVTMLTIAAGLAVVGFCFWIAANVMSLVMLASIASANRLRQACFNAATEVQKMCPEDCWGDLSIPSECRLA